MPTQEEQLILDGVQEVLAEGPLVYDDLFARTRAMFPIVTKDAFQRGLRYLQQRRIVKPFRDLSSGKYLWKTV